MAKYSHTQNDDGTYDIHRGGDLVATYSPAEDSVEYADERAERFAGPVGKEIAKINGGAEEPEAEEIIRQSAGESAAEAASAAEPTKEELKSQVSQLKTVVKHQHARIATLEEQNAAKKRSLFNNTPSRYEDPVDLTGYPPTDPNLGDLTPEFIEHARKNMPKEIFIKRYSGRISDDLLNGE